jgi:hypothetical protein
MSDRQTPKYPKDNMPDRKAFPEPKIKNVDELTRRQADDVPGPLKLTVKHWDKFTRTYENNSADVSRATAPPTKAPASTPKDLGDLLNSQGMGWKKGSK